MNFEPWAFNLRYSDYKPITVGAMHMCIYMHGQIMVVIYYYQVGFER